MLSNKKQKPGTPGTVKNKPKIENAPEGSINIRSVGQSCQSSNLSNCMSYAINRSSTHTTYGAICKSVVVED